MRRVIKKLFSFKKPLDKPGNMCYTIVTKGKEKEIKKMKFIQNIECGNIFEATTEGLREARAEAEELYDIGDPTNELSFWDYYQIIGV